MSLEMKVPTVGESISEVIVASWTKNDGDIVEMDEVICELESEKTTFEVTAEATGKLLIKAQEGDTLEIGALLCEIDESGVVASESSSVIQTPSVSSDNTSEATGEILEMYVPKIGESITEVTISSWTKATGDLVQLDEVIAEIESDKAALELTAEATGKLEIIAQEGENIEVGTLICKIEVMADSAFQPSPSQNTIHESKISAPPSNSKTYASGHASPAATKILEEKGIASFHVQGSGRDGRITKEDAQAIQKPTVSTLVSKSEVAPEAPKVTGNREQRREKMTSLRKTISRRLVSVKNETAMLTTFNEVNMKPVMNIRKSYKEAFKEKYDVGLGFMSFFTKAVCLALEEWPAVNAMIDENEIIYNDYCDISIAVSTPKGLVVPVVRNAESLSFAQIEKDIIRLAGKAREGKLSMEEMQGGTFTITNGGVFGSMMSTPIINAPQSAILGMHNIVQRAVVENGEIVVRPMMYVALSYDHRIIDGRESVSFLVRVKQLLEDPSRLLLGI